MTSPEVGACSPLLIMRTSRHVCPSLQPLPTHPTPLHPFTARADDVSDPVRLPERERRFLGCVHVPLSAVYQLQVGPRKGCVSSFECGMGLVLGWYGLLASMAVHPCSVFRWKNIVTGSTSRVATDTFQSLLPVSLVRCWRGRSRSRRRPWCWDTCRRVVVAPGTRSGERGGRGSVRDHRRHLKSYPVRVDLPYHRCSDPCCTV